MTRTWAVGLILAIVLGCIYLSDSIQLMSQEPHVGDISDYMSVISACFEMVEPHHSMTLCLLFGHKDW